MMNIRRKFLLSTLSFCLAFCLLGTNSYAAPTTFDKNDDDYGFGEFDLGTLVIDLSKGDAVVDIGKEPQGEAYYYSFKGLLFPETINGLDDSEKPKIEATELGDLLNLDKTGDYDVSIEGNYSSVTFKKLATCTCSGTLEFELSDVVKNAVAFNNHYSSWKFILSVEEKTEDKKPQQEQVVTPDEKPATVEANAHTVGEQITIDGAIYQITDLTAGNESVMYVKPEDTGIKSAIIPDTVNIDGVDYKVTDIEDNAFKGCKKLKKVTIGENVLRIGTKAFYKCKKLKKITIKTSALTKDSVDKGVFKGINENAKVKVPKKKVKAYRKIFKKKGLNGKNQKVTK